MRRWYLPSIIGILIFMLLLGWVVLSAEFRFKHPTAPGVRFVMRNGGAQLSRALYKTTDKGKIAQPLLVLPERAFDFGEMDPQAKGEHSFEFHNSGPGKLELQVAGTTCGCIRAKPEQQVVEPGQTANIAVEWTTGYLPDFQQKVNLTSNDGLFSSFQLTVTGRVKQVAAPARPELNVGAVAPEKTGFAKVLVYSQVWPAIEVLRAKASRPEYVVRTEQAEVSAKEHADRGVKSGIWVSVEVPGGGRQGSYQEHVTLELESVEGSEPRTLEIPVLVTQMRRLATYGEGISQDGEIDLDIIPQNVGKTVSYLLKVRDDDRDLKIREIKVDPEFVNVTIEPVSKAEQKGLYKLTIEIPSGAPLCNRLEENQRGRIQIFTDHPRIGEQEYQLRIAVRE